MEIINFYKKMGETPLEALERFREKSPDYQKSKLTYAGRLDPMAEGVLLILANATEEEKKKYLGLSKRYYFEIFWGIKSDTYDILGKVEKGKPELFDEEILFRSMDKLKNMTKMSYPAFSSRTVGGKPLFWWAKEGRLKEIKIPERRVKISSIKKLKNYEISAKNLLKTVEQRINLVTGDFRQKEVLALWKELLTEEKTFLISSFESYVSSGTYVRGLADFLGRDLGTGAICFKIIREKVGDYGASQLESHVRT